LPDEREEICSDKSEKPPFATGFIVDDYGPLFAYWRIARRKGREDLVENAMIKNEDLELLVKQASNGSSLGDLVDVLTRMLLDRIDPDIAVEAVRACGYKNLDRERARHLLARTLSGWLVELGESTGRLRFSSRRKTGDG
jgi:hypothetical protein